MLQFNLKKHDEPSFTAQSCKISEHDYDYAFTCTLGDGSEATLLVKDGQKWVRVCRMGADAIDYSLTAFSANYGFNCAIYNADMTYELRQKENVSPLPLAA